MRHRDGSRSRCFYAVLSGRKVVCLCRSKHFAIGFHRKWSEHTRSHIVECYPVCYPESDCSCRTESNRSRKRR